MSIKIFRFTNVSDTYIGCTDYIKFNDPSTKTGLGGWNTKVPNAFCTHYEIGNTSALAENQPPSQDNGGNQHLGAIEDLYTFYIYFSKRDAVPHAYQDILDAWKNQAKVNAAWPDGRFGVMFDDRTNKNIVPVTGTGSNLGLMWFDLIEKNDFNRIPLQSNMVLRFKVSRSDGT